MNIRRYYIPDALVFITQVIHGRQPIFQHPRHLELLLATMREAKQRYPFQMVAYVFLPDHFHLLIRPHSPVTHTNIMHSIKPNFTKAYKESIGITGPMKFWQKRYWDHIIRDAADFENHIHYIHYNPIKHGYVQKPESWPHASYRHWQAKGVYPEQWGWTPPADINNLDIDGEPK